MSDLVLLGIIKHQIRFLRLNVGFLAFLILCLQYSEMFIVPYFLENDFQALSPLIPWPADLQIKRN